LFFAVEQLVMTDCVTKASPEQERMTNERNTKDEKKIRILKTKSPAKI
jgi:hypothetical protein